MGKQLSAAQVRQYQERGYASPFTAFPPQQARAYRDRLEALEQEGGGKIPDDGRRKMHLYLRWVDEIVHNPQVLDAVEDLVGPDLLVYHVTLWMKDPHTEAFVSWHQDSTYFGLEPAEHVTAWVALSTSDVRSGCVQVLPGSHLGGQVPHSVGDAASNMLRGQQLQVPPEAQVELLELQPGQFSLHHTHLHHNSMPNQSDDRRIGLGISYIPTRCKCQADQRLTAMLVRGRDDFHHFDLEQRPRRDMDPEGLARHAEAVRRWHKAREQLIARAHANAPQ
jgi:ectoine hydroxylase-related dioxygenase (phytanoyl-CoA dioxygenase family)